VSTVVFETAAGFEHRLRTVPSEPGGFSRDALSLNDAVTETNDDIGPWELHSELVLVCPEVCERARELLPERDPDAFLARPREPVSFPAETAEKVRGAARLPAAVLGYTLWRLAETARVAIIAIGAAIALALLADVLH